MKITPVDIQHKQFRRGLQGYAREDVDAFLDDVIASLEEDVEERQRLEATIAELREKISHFKAMEESLQNTLVLAQRTADELKAAAYKEVDLAKQRGKLELDQELTELRRQISEAKKELQQTLDHADMAKHDLQMFLTRHLALLEEGRPAFGVSARAPESNSAA